MSQYDPDHIVAHTASAGAVIGVLMGWLPAVAAVIGAVWYGLQIWESATVQGWRATKRMKAWWHGWTG